MTEFLLKSRGGKCLKLPHCDYPHTVWKSTVKRDHAQKKIREINSLVASLVKSYFDEIFAKKIVGENHGLTLLC